MNVIIIDDEKSMHIIMKRMLSKIKPINIVGYFFDTWSAYEYLKKNEVDVIFIDISMPKESGLEFVERLRDEGKETKVVFVTSHKEYALPAFDVYAFDYIVKPVDQTRLQHTLGRIFTEFELMNKPHRQDFEHKKLVFNILGTMELRTTQKELIKWKTSKSAELFSYLVLQKGRRVSRARIIEDMYEALPIKNAETYLNTTVYQLRKLLSSYGFQDIIYSDNQYYALDIAQITVDSYRFEDAIKKLDLSINGDMKYALELEKSYEGDLFGEEVYRWSQNEVERLVLIYISFAHQLCATLLLLKEIDSAIQVLKRLIDNYQLEDKTMMLYMEALALKNDELGLKRQYKLFNEVMREEMGVNLSHKVTNYYQELIAKLD